MKNLKIFRNKHLRGFTLIEMMIVLIIIGILMGLIAVGSFKAIEEARESQAASAISTLETALTMYKLDVGDYPIQGAGDNSFKLWLQDGDGSSGWQGPYMSFKGSEVSGNSYIDPWKTNPYQYECPGTVHGSTTNPLDIWVEDRTDINNWD